MNKIIVFLFFLVIISSCKKDEVELDRTLPPSFDPGGGSYSTPIGVTINCETTGATIYYTLDGSDPTTSSSIYESPILLNSQTTLKAIAVKKNMSESSIKSADYTINTSIEWQQMIGGERTNRSFYSIKQTNDGGYIIIGRMYGTGLPSGVSIIKIGLDGEIEWQKTYETGDDEYYSVAEVTSDGGYILGRSTGGYGGDYGIVKLNSDLKKEWQKTFGGSDDEYFGSIQQTSDGGYIIGGDSESTDISGVTNNDDSEIYIIKINSSGNTEWQKMCGGSNTGNFKSIKQTKDGGYIITGSTFVNTGIWICGDGFCHYQWWELPTVMKMDVDGDIEWQHSYGNDYDKISSIQQTNDEGYIFTINQNDQDEESYIVKLTSAGSTEWTKYNGDDYCDYNSIQQTDDGGYVVGGEYGSDYFIFKTNSSGNKEWEQIIGGSAYDECITIQQTSDGGYILGGKSQSDDISGANYTGEGDYFYIIKLKGDNTGFVY